MSSTRRIEISPRLGDLLEKMDLELGAEAVNAKLEAMLLRALPVQTPGSQAREHLDFMAARAKVTKEIHDKRRLEKVCLNNPKHGPSVKGGRCQTCWDRKTKSESGRVRYG